MHGLPPRFPGSSVVRSRQLILMASSINAFGATIGKFSAVIFRLPAPCDYGNAGHQYLAAQNTAAVAWYGRFLLLII